jgi:SAM-dependent methyltransferase
MAEDWFREWFDEYYLMLYRHRDIDEARCQFKLIMDEVRPGKDWKVLDLACGEGRYASLFKEKGYDITGLDLSETLIRSGKRRFGNLNLRVGDMRYIHGRYDLVLSLFTSFGYFLEEQDDRRVMASVRNALNPGGIFWLDYFNPGRVERELSEGISVQVIEGMEISEEKRISGNRITKKIVFRSGTGEREYFESVRMYTREELHGMICDHGMDVVRVFGDYSGSPWGEDTERTILMCRLPAGVAL